MGCVTDGCTTVTLGGLECSLEKSLLHPGDRSRSGELLSLDRGESLPVSWCFDSFDFSSLPGVSTSGDFRGNGSGVDEALGDRLLIWGSGLMGLPRSEGALGAFSAFEALKSGKEKTKCKVRTKLILSIQ